MPESLLRCLSEGEIDSGALVVFEAPHLTPEPSHSFEDILSVLLERLGPEGTLVVPACTPIEGYPKEPFDPALSPSEAGPFSEFFRKQPAVLRSHNPTHSVAALGRLAADLVGGHRTAGPRPSPWGDAAFGAGSPWDLLSKNGAVWLLAGADWSSSFFVDYVRTLYHENQLRWTKQTAFPEFNPRHMGRELQQRGIAKPWPSCPDLMVSFDTETAVRAALAVLEIPARLGPSRQFKRWLAVRERVKREGYLRAGAAKAVITPPIPATRWDGRPLNSVYRDLYVRVIFLSDGKTSLALALCDLLGISRAVVDRIRQSAAVGLGLPPEQIMLACTHAHSTPDTVGCGYENSDYLSTVVRAAGTALEQAVRSARSARLGWRRTRARGIARSRRVKLKTGKAYTVRYSVPSTWRVSPEVIAGRGDVDPDLTVVRIEDLDGHLIAGLSNFGCHPSIALASDEVSGDWSGEAMHAMEQIFEGNAVFLATNGAGGDVDPTGEIQPWGPRNQEAASRVGRIFASEVLESLERIEIQEVTRLGAASRSLALPVRDDWLSLIEKEQARMCQEFAGQWELSDSIKETLVRRRIETEVQILRLGDLALVGLPGEVLVEMGRKIKAVRKRTAVIELANDDIGYIPTHRASTEGGYEVGRHLWGRATPDAEDILVDTARILIEELFGS
ncbi:MAG: hypothetical protein EHJ95_05840 [Methanobacteriota archaeon]|nr:MAG: hypothetical protein EHJ95_05840 [Euryarchaeota archaeon]